MIIINIFIDFTHQKWIGLLWVAIHASLNAYERVGWAWQALAKSSELAPYSIPITASEIIYPAPGPMICAPSSLSVFFSANIFTIPSVSEIAFALELARNGKVPFTYSISKFIDKITFFFKFFLSISNRSYFRESVNNWRNCKIVDMRMLSC